MNPSILDVAKRAARYHARRVPWVPLDDLFQVASEWGFIAEKSWNPKQGVPLEAYAWSVIKNRIHTYAARDGAGVVRGGVCVPFDDLDPKDTALDQLDTIAADRRKATLHNRLLRAARKAGALELFLSLSNERPLEQFLLSSGVTKKRYAVMRKKLIYHAKLDPQLKQLWEETP